MNVIKCEKGHFYDADRFESCPHCNEGKANESYVKPNTRIPTEKNVKTIGFFDEEEPGSYVVQNDESEFAAGKITEDHSERSNNIVKNVTSSREDATSGIANENKKSKKMLLIIIIAASLIAAAAIILLFAFNNGSNNNSVSQTEQHVQSQTPLSSENISSENQQTDDKTNSSSTDSEVQVSSADEVNVKDIKITGITDIGFIKIESTEISKDGYTCVSPDGAIFESDGLVIHGKYSYKINFTDEEKSNMMHGGDLYNEDGTLYESKDLECWSDSSALEYGVKLPDDIKSGTYTYSLYQTIAGEDAESVITFTVN